VFIREFLTSHLSEQVSIGIGEIIDADSQPREPRNQFDIIVYKSEYPKIDFSGGINGFLVESVIATIEVKSTLRKEDLKQSIKAANNIKKLKRNIYFSSSAFHQDQTVMNYVVAYNGPKKMRTIYDWISATYSSEGITYPPQRGHSIPSLSIDAIFVLGKGFILFCNPPISFLTEEKYNQEPEIRWEIADSPNGNLFLLFLLLLKVSTNILNPLAYAKNFSIPDENISIGT